MTVWFEMQLYYTGSHKYTVRFLINFSQACDENEGSIFDYIRSTWTNGYEEILSDLPQIFYFYIYYRQKKIIFDDKLFRNIFSHVSLFKYKINPEERRCR